MTPEVLSESHALHADVIQRQRAVQQRSLVVRPAVVFYDETMLLAKPNRLRRRDLRDVGQLVAVADDHCTLRTEQQWKR